MKKYTIFMTEDEVYIGPLIKGITSVAHVNDTNFLNKPEKEHTSMNIALLVKYADLNVDNLTSFVKLETDSLKINELEFAKDFLKALMGQDPKECDKYFTYYSTPKRVRLNTKYEEELLFLTRIFNSIKPPKSIEKFRNNVNFNSTKELISIARFAIDNKIGINNFYEGEFFDVDDLNLEKLKELFKLKKNLENILENSGLSEEHFIAYRNINGYNFSNSEDLKIKLDKFVKGLSNDISPLRTLNSSQILSLYDKNDPILIDYASQIFHKIRVYDDIEYRIYDGCYYPSLYCISKQDGLMIKEDNLLPLYLITEPGGRTADFDPDGRYHIVLGIEENGLEALFQKIKNL